LEQEPAERVLMVEVYMMTVMMVAVVERDHC
jgi:hypothetical protein